MGITFITDPEESKKPNGEAEKPQKSHESLELQKPPHEHKEPQKTKKSNQRKAAPSGVNLDGSRRLRIRELQTLFAVSHTIVYAMVKRGDIPPPDGRDSSWRKSNPGRPYWFTETIKPLVTKPPGTDQPGGFPGR